MTRKIDGLTYDDDARKLLRGPLLGEPFAAYLKKRRAAEHLRFLDEGPQVRPMKHHADYFADGAPWELNIDAPIKRRARELAEAKDWDAMKAWKKIWADAEKDAWRQLQDDYVDDFFRDDGFRRLHERLLRKTVTIAPALKKQLGVQDGELLAEIASLFLSSRKPEAQKAVKAVVKAEDVPHDEKGFVAILKKAFRFA